MKVEKANIGLKSGRIKRENQLKILTAELFNFRLSASKNKNFSATYAISEW